MSYSLLPVSLTSPSQPFSVRELNPWFHVAFSSPPPSPPTSNRPWTCLGFTVWAPMKNASQALKRKSFIFSWLMETVDSNHNRKTKHALPNSCHIINILCQKIHSLVSGTMKLEHLLNHLWGSSMVWPLLIRQPWEHVTARLRTHTASSKLAHGPFALAHLDPLFPWAAPGKPHWEEERWLEGALILELLSCVASGQGLSSLGLSFLNVARAMLVSNFGSKVLGSVVSFSLG